MFFYFYLFFPLFWWEYESRRTLIILFSEKVEKKGKKGQILCFSVEFWVLSQNMVHQILNKISISFELWNVCKFFLYISLINEIGEQNIMFISQISNLVTKCPQNFETLLANFSLLYFCWRINIYSKWIYYERLETWDKNITKERKTN